MGGRGASSGMSNSGKKYGTEYKSLLRVGNIKFVRYKDSDSAKAPMETMTKGRVYVTVNARDELVSVTYYDKANKRERSLDLRHNHGTITGSHTHHGYIHDEGGTSRPSAEETKMIAFVKQAWYTHLRK